MKKLAVSFVTLSLALVACTPADQAVIDSAMEDLSASSVGTETEQGTVVVPEEGTNPESAYHADYADFNALLLTDGQPKVLFFHASWCPLCQQADTDLKDMYGQNVFALPTYKLNYDTEKELKAKYGVTYQHTFVLVDGNGNEVRKLQSPAAADIKALLDAQAL